MVDSVEVVLNSAGSTVTSVAKVVVVVRFSARLDVLLERTMLEFREEEEGKSTDLVLSDVVELATGPLRDEVDELDMLDMGDTEDPAPD